MRGRTRNLVENFVTFIFFILILLGIYFLIVTYTDLGKNLDLVSPQNIIEKITKQEKKIEEIIEEKIIDEKDENNTFEIVPTKQKEVEHDKAENNITKKSNLKEIEDTTIENKQVSENKKQDIKDNKKKDEEVKNVTKVTEQKKDESKKEVKQKNEKTVLSDKLIKEKFALINSFLRDTKKQINEKVDELSIPQNDNKRYANIRVTVLKNGGYEQLYLMDGDKEYFKQISPAILSVFPLSLNEKIEDQFPRYFRMKIIEK